MVCDGDFSTFPSLSRRWACFRWFLWFLFLWIFFRIHLIMGMCCTGWCSVTSSLQVFSWWWWCCQLITNFILLLQFSSCCKCCCIVTYGLWWNLRISTFLSMLGSCAYFRWLVSYCFVSLESILFIGMCCMLVDAPSLLSFCRSQSRGWWCCQLIMNLFYFFRCCFSVAHGLHGFGLYVWSISCWDQLMGNWILSLLF